MTAERTEFARLLLHICTYENQPNGIETDARTYYFQKDINLPRFPLLKYGAEVFPLLDC